MRLIGDLIFAGLGQAKSLRVENLATDPVSPAAGQLWYNTTDGVYRGFDGTTVTTFASGGNTGTLQAEIDAIEAGAGLETTGAYVAPVGSNYLGTATTLKGADVLLDTQVKSNSDAISGLTTTTGNIQTEVDAIETGAGLETNGNYVAPVGSNYLGSATTLKGADVLLDTQVKANSDSIGTLTTDVAGKVSKAGDTMTGNLVISAGSHISIADAPINTTDAVNKVYVDNALNGIKWKQSVKTVAAGIIANLSAAVVATDFEVAVVEGDRVLVHLTASTDGVAGASNVNNGIYVVGAVTGGTAPLTRATDFDSTTPINEITSAALWVEPSAGASQGTHWIETASVTTLGTDAITFTQFYGAAPAVAGIGLTKTGNQFDINLGAGIVELPTNEVGIDVYANSGLFLTENGTAASTAAAAKLALQLDGTSLAVGAGGVKVAAQGVTATELAASVAGDGLTGGNGTALAVGVGTGLSVAADAVSFDTTWGDARYATLAGATFTGAVVLAADPTVALEAATKQYVDALGTKVAGGQYQYVGGTAATTHVVTHNLGTQYNAVTVYDANDKVIIPDSITADTANQLTVTFASAITCKIVVTGVKA